MTNKNFILVVILVLIGIGLNAQNLKKVESYYDPFTRTHIHEAYTTLTTPPYSLHGVYKEWDQYGNIIKEVNFVNGKKHGSSKIFIGTGAAELGGQRELLGKVIYITNYANDVLNGLDQKFDYTNGKQQLILQKTWVNGEIVKHEEWNPQGIKTKQLQMDGLCFESFPDGKKQVEYTMKNGKRDGKFTSWFSNGKIEMSTNYTSDVENGKHFEYFATGKTELEATYINGKISGTMTVYFPDGKILKSIKYDPTTFSLLEENVFANNGKQKFERVIVSNNQCKSTTYDSISGNKSIEQEELYDNASNKYIKNGHTIKYFSDGKVNIDCFFTNDKLNGMYKEVDQGGNIIKSGELKFDEPIGEWVYTYNDKWEEVKSKKEASYFRKINFDTGKGPWKTNDFYITGERQFVGLLVGLSPDVPAGNGTYYRKDGSIEEEDILQSDGLIKVITYHTNGKQKEEKHVRNGQLNGKFKQYDESGFSLADGEFTNGKKTGEWKILMDSSRNQTLDKNRAVLSRSINYGNGDAPWQVTDSDMNSNKVIEGSLAKESPDVFTGKLKFFGKSGKVVHTIDYFPAGVVAKEYKYFYSKDGKLLKEGHTDGPEVIWTEYPENGGTKNSYTPISDPSWKDENYEQGNDSKNTKGQTMQKLKSLKKFIN